LARFPPARRVALRERVAGVSDFLPETLKSAPRDPSIAGFFMFNHTESSDLQDAYLR